MKVKVEKIAELEYNQLITLNIIENDADLLEIFKEENNLPFTILYRMSKDNSLPEDIKTLIFELFDKVISTKKNYIEQYQKLINTSPTQVIPETKDQATQKDDVVIEPKEIKPVVKKTPIVETKTKALPKRYGKQAIEQDIEKQGGKATNAQLTALALNSLKNIYSKLNARLVKDMLTEDKVFTDDDYRDIRSSIKIVENKLKNTLKKK